MKWWTRPSGLRPGAHLAAGVPEDGMHVQGGDLLQGDASAEGAGGRAGQEVQTGGHAGDRRRSQRCEHDQRYQQQRKTM